MHKRFSQLYLYREIRLFYHQIIKQRPTLAECYLLKNKQNKLFSSQGVFELENSYFESNLGIQMFLQLSNFFTPLKKLRQLFIRSVNMVIINLQPVNKTIRIELIKKQFFDLNPILKFVATNLNSHMYLVTKSKAMTKYTPN